MDAEAGGYDGDIGVEGAGVDIDGGGGGGIKVGVLRYYAQGVIGVGGEPAERVSGAGGTGDVSTVFCKVNKS